MVPTFDLGEHGVHVVEGGELLLLVVEHRGQQRGEAAKRGVQLIPQEAVRLGLVEVLINGQVGQADGQAGLAYEACAAQNRFSAAKAVQHPGASLSVNGSLP